MSPGTTSSSPAGRPTTSPTCKATVEAGGGTYIDADANLSTEQQLTDIDTLISKGANVLVLLAQDTQAILPAVAKAKQAGIPIIAYDRLIEDPSILYITFDNVAVGKAEAAALLAKVPTGNYVIIKGDPGDPNASTFLPQGFKDAGLLDAVNAGKIKILNSDGTTWPDNYGTFTDAWKTENAQTNMEAIIDKANSDGNTIDAVLAENDSTALGVVAAETAKGIAFAPLSGQDGDPANLNNLAQGKQYVDIWKNANELGKAAGAAALALCAGGDMATPHPAGRPDRPQRRTGRRPHGTALHHPRWQHRLVLHPAAHAAHRGQPAAGRRRQPDLPG